MAMLGGETYTYDSRPEFSFRVLGKRYVHNVEPMLRRLFGIASAPSSNGDTKEPLIREAWSLECPNHSESAVLNEMELNEFDAENGTWSSLLSAEAAHRFLTSKPGGVDLTTHSLVYVGHSIVTTRSRYSISCCLIRKDIAE
ncbi:hypothetical protein OF83DRAFT_1171369 [Amylostereum chailletii]|nr:hypothetical protein OF83DRAFT_1171369 [Amylostereum chailletii]